MTSKKEAYDHIYSVLGRQYALPAVDRSGPTKERVLMTATMLFAQRGYADVSMRDIAQVNGVKASSLYNHFNGKAALWAAVLDHIKKLYAIYIEHLVDALSDAETFEEILSIVFHEPKRLANIFTCYGFSLVLLEQVRDDLAAETFNFFITAGVEAIAAKIDERQGLRLPFAARTAALLITNNTFMGLLNKVQQLQGRKTPYETESMLADMERFILTASRAPAS